MKLKRNLALTHRITLTIVVLGLIPAVVIGWLAIRTAGHMAEDIGFSFEHTAESISDKIDRSLFERYGDVQAFGANDAVLDQKAWYQPGSDKNKIAATANRYVALYGIYPLSYLVDLEGRVIAVNDRDLKGQPIDTAWLYQKNFKDAEWFRQCLAGAFLKSDVLDGTYVQNLHVDEDVKRACRGDGLVLGFSAPVRDAAGKTIAVWHNCADLGLVEEIVVDAYQQLKEEGFAQAELTVIDSAGRVLVEFEPANNGGKETVTHDPAEILKHNLISEGLECARAVVAGKSGHGDFTHAGRPFHRITGDAPCNGELGFPGLKWGVLVRVPKSQALAAMQAQVRHILIVLGLSLAGLIGTGVWLGRSIARPLIQGIGSIRDVGAQVSEAAGQFSASSQVVAESASEQAASLEETSASLEEISAMTKRNAENSVSSKALSQQARDSASTGLERLGEMGRTLNSIKSAVQEKESAVREMQSSSQEISKIIKTIDEIAFQTNLLALNAAVEAARAGEAGMGFAVVADEVRALAQRSAQAAKDTSEKIEAAVKRSELGGVASKKVAHSLNEVEANAQNIGQVFNGIVTQIKALDEIISEIAAASKEQSQGIGEVNMAVSQMDKVTQTNASSAEENASAAEELTSQVGSLRDIVIGLQAVISGTANRPPDEPSHSAPRKAQVAFTPSKTPAPAVARASRKPAKPGALDFPMPEPGAVAVAKGGFTDF